MCGHGGYGERISKVQINVHHFGPTALVTLYTNLNEAPNNESWGIRDFSMSFVNGEEVDASLTGKFDNAHTDGWISYNNKAGPVTNCGGVTLLGGYNAFGLKASAIKEINDLEAHEFITIDLEWWALDTWDNEYFYIYADGVKVYEM